MLGWLTKSVWNLLLLIVGVAFLVAILVSCTLAGAAVVFWPDQIVGPPGPQGPAGPAGPAEEPAQPEEPAMTEVSPEAAPPVDPGDPNANAPAGFPRTQQEVMELLKLQYVALDEIRWCYDGVGGYESNCWWIPREKEGNTDEVRDPYWIGAQPFDFWQDGFRHESGQLRPGNCPLPDKSGIPPDFSGWIEGITLRAEDPQSCDVAASSISGTPMAPETPADWPQTPEEVISFFRIEGLDVNQIHPLVGEQNTWEVLIQPTFHFENLSGCPQDGAYLVAGQEKYTIPDGFVGDTVAFTLRPCAP